VGLFAGIGGIELGLHRAGHRTLTLCEIDPPAKAVLADRFPDLELHSDVTTLENLPDGTDLVAAGFPCQDLSQAGLTKGIRGKRSGLVGEIFRLLENSPTPWVLLENVPFMLRLGRGAALDVIINAFENLGYKWAYRVVDSRAFGLPQRRERVFFVASLGEDPRGVLLADEVGEPLPRTPGERTAYGFYWTEGSRGLGWAIDAVPTLKGGSTVGIPSPPAIVLPSGEVVKPSIEDAERLQGFPRGWTEPAERVARPSFRWKLIGNAVTVNVAEWIGVRLSTPGTYGERADTPLAKGAPWPDAAYNVGKGRYQTHLSRWPVAKEAPALLDFLDVEQLQPLSFKATAGFLSRFEASSLRKPPGFVKALRSHLRRMEMLEKQSGRSNAGASP
jgi:DNA (cytosine-5)-methyltransferase 1